MTSPRSQGWVLTINYKDSNEYEQNTLYFDLQKLDNIQYFVYQLEKGESGTVHHQIYLYFKKRVHFTYLKEVFPKAHIEIRKGSHKQAKEYCTKTDTRLQLPQEWGDEPQQGVRNDLADILDMINDGYSLTQIIATHPTNYIRYRNSIEYLYQKHKSDLVENQFRKLEVVYLSGKTGVGKTSTIMKHYGFNKVYRVVDYKNPFDTYNGQEVIILDEFHSQFKIEFMLNLLDGYPLKLPARYNDKVAQFTKVYIISNEPLDKQYKNIQADYIDTFEALKRRIHYQFDLQQLKIHLSLPF